MKKKRKGKITPKNSTGKKVVKDKCYHYNEDGHWLRNCPKYLAEKKPKKEVQGSSSKFRTKEVISIEAVGDLKLF
ncbi:gag/pol protein [Cucumis melo var. makuwa]|uniref:Gag/pol protein n=1 Tax=Cucumis melo var. makuwa TaxID=1194695 RepID=A0A5A7VPJ5_CUCMM|nr:gag/pol protein [Cucumis melo var. makuwa]TYJ97459.1 gag/pol protein [Cucumis melo var. makuwa]